jgi:predicted lipoprotein with Yx(FWY)xxD motif
MSSASAPASGMSSTASRSAAVLTVSKTPIGYVLANANGYTVYWFARDPGAARTRPAPAPACSRGACGRRSEETAVLTCERGTNRWPGVQ